MIKTLFAGACLFVSFNAFSFDCTAIDRYVEKGEHHESKAALVFTLENEHTLKMEVEHKGQFYFVTYNKEDDDALLQIVNSADDTKGIVVRASFNKYGIMSVSSVDGQVVHRMECFK
jgi:hypothetical protein